MAAATRPGGYQPSHGAGGPPSPQLAGRAAAPGRHALPPARRLTRPPAPERRLTEQEFRALLDHGTAEDMADVLLILEEPARRALTVWLPAHATPDAEATLLVAGAGCLSGADRLAAWLRSRRFHQRPSEQTLEATVRVMSAAGRPRLATVAAAMARQLERRAAWPGEWAVTEALLLAAEIPPPVTDSLARRWIRERAAAGPSLAERLAADPWLDRLLPRVFFPPDGVGIDHHWAAALTSLASDQRLARGALIRLALRRLAEPSRAGSFSAVVALHQMLSPTVAELAKHRAEYHRLVSSPHAAVKGLARQALATLASAKQAASAPPASPAPRLPVPPTSATPPLPAPPTSATPLPPAPPTPSPSLAPPAPPTLAAPPTPTPSLARPAPLVSSAPPAVSRIPRSPSAQPAATAPSPSHRRVFPAAPARAAADPMPAPIASVAELAAEMAARRPDPWEPVALERLLAGLVTFAMADRPATAAALLPLLDGTASPLDDLIRGFTHSTPEIRPGSDAPARPDQYRHSWETHTDPLRDNGIARPLRDNGIARLIGTSRSAEPGPIGRPRQRPTVPAPQAMVLARLRELATQLATGGPPALLATPATVDGHVSPARLLFRLLDAERDGWQPGPYDLTQALLRLPRHVDAGTAEAVSRLVSPAGRRYAAWLRSGGLTDPATTASTAPGNPARRTVSLIRTGPPTAPDANSRASTAGGTGSPSGTGSTGATGRVGGTSRVGATGRVGGTGSTGGPTDLLRRLLTEAPEVRAPERPSHAGLTVELASPCAPGITGAPGGGGRVGTAVPVTMSAGTATPGYTAPAEAAATGGPGPDMRCWPMVLPSHRDIVAAHCLPHLGHGGDAGSILVELARADGPFGPAMAVALARGLVSAWPAERETATEALLHLAGHGGLDAALLARELRVLIVAGPDRGAAVADSDPGGALPGSDPGGALAGAGRAGLVAEVLAALGRADAWHLAWAVAYDVVPAMVRLDRVPGGAAALVAVAAEAAEATGARADLPDVAVAATRASDQSLRAELTRLARAIL